MPPQVAAFAELGEELGGVRDALGPSLMQVGLVRVEDAGAARPLTDQQLLSGRGVGKTSDRSTTQAQLACDRPQTHALVQMMDSGVLLPNAVGEAPRYAWSGRCLRIESRRVHGRSGAGSVCVRMWFPQQATMMDDGLFDGLHQVLPDVPWVRNVDRFGGSESSDFRIGNRSIPADHLDAGVIGEPLGNRGHRPVRQ
jgi:hypothetical protein